MLKNFLEPSTKDNSFVFILKSLFSRFNEHKIAQIGGQLAYFFLLSIYPFLIFLNVLIGSFDITNTAVIDFLKPIFPVQIVELISSYVEHITQNQSAGLLSFGIVVVIFSASRAVRTLDSIINNAYGIKEKRGFFYGVTLSMLFILLMGFLLLIAILFVAFSRNLFLKFFSVIPIELVSLISTLRWLVLVFTLVFVLAMLYYIIPNKKIRFRNIIPGTLFSSAGFIALTLGFSTYVSHFMRESALYGTIGAVLLLTLWLYIAGIILTIGAELNSIMEILPERKKQKGVSEK